MNNFNFLWLGDSKKYLNMALVTNVDIANSSDSTLIALVYTAGNPFSQTLRGPDAEQIIEYLKRNAYH